MTKHEKIIVSAYTGILMCDFHDVHQYIEEKLGRPVQTYELTQQSVTDELRDACREDFIALCAKQEDDKQDNEQKEKPGLYRFYRCESEDSYLLGMRVGNFYYAHWNGNSFSWDMSRYLPWDQHVSIPSTAWKEHTYPSEPIEISADEWMNGMLRKDSERPVTNGDHIRQMTDAELVDIIECKDDDDEDMIKRCLAHECKDCCLKWLRQPYEGGNDNAKTD
jgi:hypothetical protein